MVTLSTNLPPVFAGSGSALVWSWSPWRGEADAPGTAERDDVMFVCLFNT